MFSLYILESLQHKLLYKLSYMDRSRQLQGKWWKQEGAASGRWGAGLIACRPRLVLRGDRNKGPSLDDCPHCLYYCSISWRSQAGSNRWVHNSHPRVGKVGRKQSLGSHEFLPKLKSMDRVAEVTGVLEKEPKKPKEVVCDPESGERSLSTGSTGSTRPGWTSLGLGGHLAFF